MAENKNDNFLSNEEIIKKAVSRLTNEYEDFCKYNSTDVFTRILGAYNAKKDEKVKKEDVFNEHMSQYALTIAKGIAKPVCEVLKSFCTQNSNFANLVIRSRGNFTSCLAYAIHAFVDENSKNVRSASLSDIETYRRAVSYYSGAGSINFVMNVAVPDTAFVPITEEELSSIRAEYAENCKVAEQEKIAAEKAAAERKAKAEQQKKEREAKEAKKKEKEKIKKAREELKKAQGKLFEENSAEEIPTPVPTPKKTEHKSVFVTPVENTETTNKDNIIQLTLF